MVSIAYRQFIRLVELKILVNVLLLVSGIGRDFCGQERYNHKKVSCLLLQVQKWQSTSSMDPCMATVQMVSTFRKHQQLWVQLSRRRFHSVNDLKELTGNVLASSVRFVYVYLYICQSLRESLYVFL